jgi:hypothetical protein
MAKTNVLDRVIADKLVLYEAAEEILWRLGPDEPPTGTERQILKEFGIVDANDLVGERGRVDRVKTLLEQAGTPEQMVAAEKASIFALQAEREQLPALEEQLATIQAKINELAEARATTADTLHKLTASREMLRNPRLLPAYVREAYEAELQKARTTDTAARVREIERTIEQIDALQRIDLNQSGGVQSAKLHCEAAVPNLITRTVSNVPGSQNQSASERFDTDSFRKYRESRLKVERPNLERELAELKDQHESTLAKVARQLDHYLDNI